MGAAAATTIGSSTGMCTRAELAATLLATLLAVLVFVGSIALMAAHCCRTIMASATLLQLPCIALVSGDMPIFVSYWRVWPHREGLDLVSM